MAAKIAHSVVVTPHKAGLYETARDLVAAERLAGLDARLVDPVKAIEGEDRGVPIANRSFASEADLVVNHSGLGGEMDKPNLKIIHILHGRPYSSFLLEQQGKIAVYSHLRRIAHDPRYKAFVTFWPDFVPYFENIFGQGRVSCVTPPVDLAHWTPDGPDGYGFHGERGLHNVVCTDMWREDKEPYHVLNALLWLADTQRVSFKVHIYAAPQKGTAWGVLKAMLRDKGILGECVSFVKGLEHVYRAADVMVTPHRMATRSVREALACGCSVVMAPGNGYTAYAADPEDIPTYAGAVQVALGETMGGMRLRNRATAVKLFDSQDTAAQMIEIIEKVTNGGE